jgi:cupin domain
MAKRIELTKIPVKTGSGYPTPFDLPCAARARQRLGDAAGLSDFGVNLLRLPPGVWSSQRHWHSAEDEFVFIVEGEVVLVTDTVNHRGVSSFEFWQGIELLRNLQRLRICVCCIFRHSLRQHSRRLQREHSPRRHHLLVRVLGAVSRPNI